MEARDLHLLMQITAIHATVSEIDGPPQRGIRYEVHD
jgi:hypothetical protein